MVDGETIFSDEIVWEPVEQTDPAYHYERIVAALKLAQAKLPGSTRSAAVRPA